MLHAVDLCNYVNNQTDLPGWESLSLTLSAPLTDHGAFLEVSSFFNGTEHILQIGDNQCSLNRLIILVARKILSYRPSPFSSAVCNLSLQERKWAHISLKELESLYAKSSTWSETVFSFLSIPTREEILLSDSLERISTFSHEEFNSLPSEVLSRLHSTRYKEGVIVDLQKFQENTPELHSSNV